MRILVRRLMRLDAAFRSRTNWNTEESALARAHRLRVAGRVCRLPTLRPRTRRGAGLNIDPDLLAALDAIRGAGLRSAAAGDCCARARRFAGTTRSMEWRLRRSRWC